MNTTITYRLLTNNDKAQYRILRLECLQLYPDNFGVLYQEEIAAPTLKFDMYLERNTTDSFVYGAFDNDTLIGMCGFIHETRIKKQHRGTISNMYVRKEYKGNGIGTMLLRQTIQHAFRNESIEIIELGVVHNNSNAIELYKRLGFTQYSYLHHAFKHNGTYWDQLIMCLHKSDYQ